MGSPHSFISRTEATLDLRSLIVPTRYARRSSHRAGISVCAIVPSYIPDTCTLRLVEDLVRYNAELQVFVVDDCTSQELVSCTGIFEQIARVSDRVMVLRTPKNKLKAGALNHALEHIKKLPDLFDVIVTLDDDVVITETTIQTLVSELMSCPSLGAACSQSRVANKNKNLLTRLQGLEYLGFNAIRMADDGFMHGPLVMHGMLTAFRGKALGDAGGFTEGHLIEDYEVTVRLKSNGWRVRSVVNAPASTVVPETLPKFWRQRTRWSYGGLMVVSHATRLSTVFQDVLGHCMFTATIALVLMLQLSKGGGLVPSGISKIIIALSLFQLGVSYAFQLWLMKSYKERDVVDWALRISLIPEFIYGYIMTAALIGSYLYFVFNTLTRQITEKSFVFLRRLASIGNTTFRLLGFVNNAWGTRV